MLKITLTKRLNNDGSLRCCLEDKPSWRVKQPILNYDISKKKYGKSKDISGLFVMEEEPDLLWLMPVPWYQTKHSVSEKK